MNVLPVILKNNATIQSTKEIANNSYICVKRYPRDIFFYGIMLDESEF